MNIKFDSAKVAFNFDKLVDKVQITIGSSAKPSGHVLENPSAIGNGLNPSGFVKKDLNPNHSTSSKPNHNVNVKHETSPSGFVKTVTNPNNTNNNPSNSKHNIKQNLENGVDQNSGTSNTYTSNTSSVRGAQSSSSTLSTVTFLSLSTLTLLGYGLIKKTELFNFSYDEGFEKYIYIRNNWCEINPLNVSKYKTIVKIDDELVDIENNLEFNVENISEVIFIKVENSVQTILDIRRKDGDNWVKDNNSKYYDFF